MVRMVCNTAMPKITLSRFSKTKITSAWYPKIRIKSYSKGYVVVLFGKAKSASYARLRIWHE